jgi:tetratricopeptide (TPR) repeat protein
MSLITDLLSKLKQTGPRKDAPPGLTNSINAYKKRETKRKRAVVLTAVIFAALLSGFTTIYVIKLVLGGPAGDISLATDSGYEGTMSKSGDVPKIVTSKQSLETKTLAPSPPPEKAQPSGVKPAVRATLGKTDAAPTAEVGGSKSIDAAQLYYKALDYEKAGNILKAVGSYSEALKLEPLNYRLMNKIASLFIEMRMWEEASSYLDTSVRLNGEYAPALINFGIVKAELGRFKEAEGYLSRALDIEPLNRLPLFNMALLYEKQGMLKEAGDYYRRLKRLSDPQGKKGLKRIEGRHP